MTAETRRIFASLNGCSIKLADTTHLARWQGPPTLERQIYLETQFLCDDSNKRGGGYGALYRKIRGRWVKLERCDFKPIPLFRIPVPVPAIPEAMR